MDFTFVTRFIGGSLTDGDKVFLNKLKSYINDEDATIDVKYTDDEYGKSAKELGMIKHSYDGDAGIDLPTVFAGEYRAVGLTIFPGERKMLHTGLRVAFPKGYWGRIIHRSSTEKKYRLRIIEGVIDQYRNELLVQVHNMNTFPVDVKHGQRLAQLIVLKTASFKCKEVDELPPSDRGSNGFGSSGK
jgi:dUTP pyrophosphatase